MNRFLVATSGVLFLAAGCVPETPVAKSDCVLEAIDLSACDRSGLAAVPGDGIWNVELLVGEASASTVLRLRQGKESFLGGALSARKVDAETFYVGTDLVDGYGQPMSFVLAGCQAPSPERVTGEFRRCTYGELDRKGTFEAVRIQRLAGEQEGSGVQLVGEKELKAVLNGKVEATAAVAVDVTVAGGYAYVSALSRGLYIFDVSDPTTPMLKKVLPTLGDSWNQARVVGQTLYIASNTRGVLVYDVSNPVQPVAVTAVPNPPVPVQGLVVDPSQNRLYAMSPAPRAEVLVFDLSTPTTPALRSRYLVEDGDVSKGHRPVSGAVDGNRLYIANWAYGLAVADVTAANAPAPLGRFPYEGATSRSVAVGTIGDKTVAFESSEDWGSSVRALDVTDPANIVELGRFQLRPESTVSGLTLAGTKLYVAHNHYGLRVFDVSDPYQFKPAGYYNTWRETDALRGQSFLEGLSAVAVPGDGYIYAAESSRGLIILSEQG